MDKKECPNCGKKFTPNSGKQKYCSDRCKVAFGRKLADGKEVKTASEVPAPVVLNRAVFKEDKEQLELIELGKQFKVVCKSKKMDPQDMLVWIDENYGRPIKKTEEKNKQATAAATSYLERRRNAKSFGK